VSAGTEGYLAFLVFPSGQPFNILLIVRRSRRHNPDARSQ
jgi:hypothetical protein